MRLVPKSPRAGVLARTILNRLIPFDGRFQDAQRAEIEHSSRSVWAVTSMEGLQAVIEDDLKLNAADIPRPSFHSIRPRRGFAKCFSVLPPLISLDDASRSYLLFSWIRFQGKAAAAQGPL